MSRRLLPHPLLSAALLITWLLLANHFSAGQLLLGAALGWALPLLLRRLLGPALRPRRGLALLRLLGRVLIDIAAANLQVARLVLGSNARLRPQFVELPLALHSDFGIAVLASTISLTPGTVSAELSADRRHLLIHALHVDDAQALIDHIKLRYERPLREIFEC